MPTEHMGTLRGYDLCRVRTIVRTQQDGDVVKEQYNAYSFQNDRLAARAKSLDELREKVAALPQAYSRVGDFVFELTHDRGDPRDIVVNVYDSNDALAPGPDRLPWSASSEQIKEAIKGIVEATPEEVAELVYLCRTAPQLPDDDGN
jgi:hypothetical protein